MEQAAADERDPGRKPRWITGDLGEPLRPIHALPIVLGVGAQLSIAFSLSGWTGAAAGWAGLLAGVWVGDAGVALESQARLAIQAEAQKRERSGGKLEVMEKCALTLREFSRMAKAKAKASVLDAGFKWLARPVFWAQDKTERMPRLNAAISRLEGPMEELARSSGEADFEWELRQGPKHCERLFFASLRLMEAGDWSGLAEHLQPLWRAANLTGASLEPGAGSKGPVARRLGEAVAKLEADPEKLMEELDPGELGALKELIRLCEVSAEAVELGGVVGEARAVKESARAVKARL